MAKHDKSKLRKGMVLSRDERLAFVKAHADDMTIPEIMRALKVGKNTVVLDRRFLGLVCSPEVVAARNALRMLDKSPWTEALYEILDLMHPVMHSRDLAALLGVSRQSVLHKASQRKVRRIPTPESARALRAKKARVTKLTAPRDAKPAAAKVVKVTVAKIPKQIGARPAGITFVKPMTPLQRDRFHNERISYPNGLPFRARIMSSPVWTPPALFSGPISL